MTPSTTGDATGHFTVERRIAADHLTRALRADAQAGLTESPKSLPPKWFYDARGSMLFDRITRLPEYYLTRAERMVLRANAPRVAELTGARALVELGSGSSEKTRILLDALTAAGTLRRYAPLDVSESALTAAGQALAAAYPGLAITATVADFETDLALPEPSAGPRLVAFLGSTLGNLDTEQRAAFLGRLRQALTTEGDALLLGVDLVKDPARMLRAYDDGQGVTAEFNKNLLTILNRELDADFDPGAFDHRAIWNEEEERMEMRLRARVTHSVKIPTLDLTLDFLRGEDLRTEISVKFRREGLEPELAQAGFTLEHWWTDQQERFAVLLAVPA
ncbi:L-histidine N(alpha)-methyltransferase [Streptomyces millisiae]|uniref:L-histidine N(Alpha)-methyltransferase n=1 Tax=Streptomyces millisiae TaxID=3075542 RepID=A0ABU2LY86_9ACTN|nr:L-histidine N(alpha)-methyltransferase [Streptomyces sp. DSM 44918]MDT0322233.1 L-histidine N(alpha)-methyltransferase [Streptomyces sp. DSM 44918]